MSITAQQSRAARAFLGWSQAQLAAKLKCASSTIAAFELGVSSPQPRLMEALIATLESAGIVFIEPREGEHGLAVGLKWGFTLPQRQPGEGTAASAAGEDGLKAAWDDIEEATDADLDALLSEPSVPNPDMAELWRADPQAWERLSQIGRETLSRSMFGDCRAAAEGYFQSEHHAG